MVQHYVDEFKNLAAINNVAFKNSVTIGFKKLNANNEGTVGLCTYGYGWREIDIDETYWSFTNEADRIALIFHELSHCYCTRDHDWAEGQKYPETKEARTKEFNKYENSGVLRPGRMADDCPSSLMYPVVVNNQCLKEHYDHYVIEMFDRCRPY